MLLDDATASDLSDTAESFTWMFDYVKNNAEAAPNSKEMKELLGYMARHHEDLEKTFTDEQKEIFEKFHDCWDEYVSLAEAAIFEYAFRLGARLTMEVQKDHNRRIE